MSRSYGMCEMKSGHWSLPSREGIGKERALPFNIAEECGIRILDTALFRGLLYRAIGSSGYRYH